jgi:Carboxypeptidase regulatory-like domain
MQLGKAAALAALISLGGHKTAFGQDSSTTPVSNHGGRLLGAFDAETGAPIEGASVVDILNGATALTTTTGTVTLTFLPRGTSLVRIQKIGYKPTTLPVTISAADTVPITVLLTRLVQSLPAVIITDSAPHYLTAALRGFE